MIRENIYTIGIVFCCLLVLASCNTEQKQQVNEVQLSASEREMAVKEIAQNNEQQLALMNAQEEIQALKIQIDELKSRLETVQAELDECKNKPQDVEQWEQKYNKLQVDNESLRKMVEYERNLREELLKRVEQDQITIIKLKNRLEE